MNGRAEVTRRGPVELFVSGPPLHAPADLEDRIQQIWEAERAARPTIVNDSIVCLTGVTGDRLDACLADYRLFVARERDSVVRDRLGLRAIGVSGVVVLVTGEILVGRRSDDVTEYAGVWELVPSGSLSAAAVGADGLVDTLGALFAELEEETGIDRSAVTEVVALGMVWDAAQDGFDICYELRIASDVTMPMFADGEYRDLQLLASAQLDDLIERSDLIVPTSRALLALRREP